MSTTASCTLITVLFLPQALCFFDQVMFQEHDMRSRRGITIRYIGNLFSSAACNHNVKFNFLWSITVPVAGIA